MSFNSQRFLNVGLRLGTLGVRFLFVFFLAKYLQPSSVGYYGLFTATIGYSLYIVGMDYYVFTTREIIGVPNEHRGRMLKGQATLAALVYLALLPVAVLLLSKADWPGYLVWWFVPILLLEHFNQEVSRLLIALSEQVAASVILFLRQGSWAIAIVAAMHWHESARSLDAVMLAWACAGLLASAFGIWKLFRLRLGGWRSRIDWIWIKKGIAVSALFLIATLALRATQTADRYWLEALGGIDLVGAYVLFFGVAGALLVFLDASVFSFTYPNLIASNRSGAFEDARHGVRRMLTQTVLSSLAFVAVSWLLLPHLLDWVGNAVYRDAIGLYPWILGATVLNAIGMVPHYALYALGYDKPIIYSHILALPVFGLSTWALSAIDPFVAVPAGLGVSFMFILAWKSLAYWKMSGTDKRGPVSRFIQR